MPVLTGEAVPVCRQHIDKVSSIFIFAAVAGAGGKEPAGGAARGVVFGAGIYGVEFTVWNDVLGGEQGWGQEGEYK